MKISYILSKCTCNCWRVDISTTLSALINHWSTDYGGFDNQNVTPSGFDLFRQEKEPDNTNTRALLFKSTHTAEENHDHSIEHLYLPLYGVRIN